MTVAELVAALAGLPQDWPVCFVAPVQDVAYEIADALTVPQGTYLPVDALVGRGAYVLMRPE